MKTMNTLMILGILAGCTAMTPAIDEVSLRVIEMDSSVGQTRETFQQNFLYRKGEVILLNGKLDADPGRQGQVGKIVPCEGARDATDFIPKNGPSLSEDEEKKLIEAMHSGDFGWTVSYTFAALDSGEYAASNPTRTLEGLTLIERAPISALDGKCWSFLAEITHDFEITATSIVSSVEVWNVYE